MSEDRLRNAAIEYEDALAALDAAHKLLIEELQAAHSAGAKPSALAARSGLSRMTVRKHCSNPEPIPVKVDIPTV